MSLLEAMNAQALSAKTSPIVSSFQSAALPPFIQPMRPTPFTSAMLCPWDQSIFSLARSASVVRSGSPGKGFL